MYKIFFYYSNKNSIVNQLYFNLKKEQQYFKEYHIGPNSMFTRQVEREW